MTATMHSLTPDFDRLVLHALSERALNLEQPARLAAEVMRLSDFYLGHPGEPTPWSEPYAAAAYLAYFQPLNFVRLRAAWQEVKRFLRADSITQIWDFGSGIGTTQWVLESETLAPRPLFAIEHARPAVEIYQALCKDNGARWNPQFIKKAEPAKGALGVFSYSFLEMQAALPDLSHFSHLLIVEPSTRECGRELMAWREKLMTTGFLPLAPCTHSAPCPLLTHSGKDWCHQRIHFSAPAWFERLESHLPMKNRTLTYSYLLLSQTIEDHEWRGSARAIGDTLKENGKTRQMICRGPEREFLSWLHKLGPAPDIPHGALVRGVEKSEAKGNELRPPPNSLSWTQ
jgi:hypothetical protein